MRRLSLGLAFVVALGAAVPGMGPFVAPAFASDTALDTSTLARLSGSTVIYASPATTIYTSREAVPAAVAAAFKLLTSDGWQLYSDPFSSAAQIPDQSTLTLKKESQGLTLFVTLAPAQGNASNISYIATAIADELPFFAGASDIKYAPSRPHLAFVTDAALADVLTFYRDALTQRGWAGWSRKDKREAAATEDASEANERGRFAFFVRKDQQPLMVMLQSRDDKRLSVSIERVPEKLLVIGDAKDEVAEKDAQAPAAAPTPAPDTDDTFNALAGSIMKEVQKATEQALQDVGKPPKASAPTGPVERLSPMTDVVAPVPLPSTAEQIEIETDSGSVTFTSPSSVQSIAAFYRETMKGDGWQPEHSVIDKDTMVVLRFRKGEQDLSFKILAFGSASRVDVSGSGLGETAPADTTASKSEDADAVAFTKEIKSGLPVPAPNTSSGYEKSLFRVSANASVRAPLDAVLTFYRRELLALGWTEQPGAALTKNEARIAFATAEGPATLLLVHRDGETTSTVTLRNEAAARKAGMLPAGGKTKLLIGNVLDKEAVLTIDKKAVKVAAGSGANGPDGPTLEVGPGKHTYSLRAAGVPPVTDTFEVASGDVWGLMIGPGGVLPVQMY